MPARPSDPRAERTSSGSGRAEGPGALNGRIEKMYNVDDLKMAINFCCFWSSCLV